MLLKEGEITDKCCGEHEKIIILREGDNVYQGYCIGCQTFVNSMFDNYMMTNKKYLNLWNIYQVMKK
jgi:hypothetical protein